LPAQHNYDSERELWDTYAEPTAKEVFESEPVFRWTQYGDHGPGTELLGNPESALEIGCGTGRMLAYLAKQGVKVTGVDLSPVMVKNTSERWGRSVRSSSAPKFSNTSGTIQKRTTRFTRSLEPHGSAIRRSCFPWCTSV
jgi:SAM-dependent methyltransferase